MHKVQVCLLAKTPHKDVARLYASSPVQRGASLPVLSQFCVSRRRTLRPQTNKRGRKEPNGLISVERSSPSPSGVLDEQKEESGKTSLATRLDELWDMSMTKSANACTYKAL